MNYFPVGTNLPLTFAPENGHMLGGSMVNLTGPCFQPSMRVTCRFNTKDSDGVVLNENRASCIMPWTEAEGWVDFEVALDGGPFYWKGRIYVGKFIKKYCLLFAIHSVLTFIFNHINFCRASISVAPFGLVQ